ncbi:hypothetical protein KC614_02290 [candidate division WWE3 bacterium]|uniref:DUF983 domain-containing protein n=1 Tax=candidate division WWE3 bacterium TaxID=2053526 RepID=A0A955LKH9_UNCKA|nr:hypothetical protein [candidate division WWE3 bacterium]
MTFMQFAGSINPMHLKCRQCNSYFSFSRKNVIIVLVFCLYALIFGATLGVLGEFITSLKLWHEIVIVLVAISLIGLPLEYYFWLSNDYVKTPEDKSNSADRDPQGQL